MKYRVGFALVGMGLLAACDPITQGATRSDGVDQYFSVNVGRQAGRAEALASRCASLQFNEAFLTQTRGAICQRRGLGASCELPSLDAEKARMNSTTLSRIESLSPEETCAFAISEARADETLRSYFVGLPVPRAAAPVVVAPVEVPVPDPIPEPEPETEPSPEPEPETEPEVVEEPTETPDSST